MAAAVGELRGEVWRPGEPRSGAYRTVGIAIQSMFRGDALDQRWPAWAGKTTDGVSIQYWKTVEEELVVYAIVEQGFSAQRRFPVKAVFGPEQPTRIQVFLGNLDTTSMDPPEYPEAIIVEMDGGPILVTKKASPILWTEV